MTAPQRGSVIYFFGFAWGFGCKNWQRFLEKIEWSPFPQTKYVNLRKGSGEFLTFSVEMFGPKNRIGKCLLCTFSGLICMIPNNS